MKIIIKATNLELTPAIEDWVNEKLGGLAKYEPALEKKDMLPSGKEEERVELWVEIGKTTRGQRQGEIFRAEAQTRLFGQSLRAEATNEDLYSAIGEVENKLQRLIVETKEKQKK